LAQSLGEAIGQALEAARGELDRPARLVLR
jgi:hypothetical protein